MDWLFASVEDVKFMLEYAAEALTVSTVKLDVVVVDWFETLLVAILVC